MKDQFIQSLNAYTTALEQKLAALEQRVAQLEEANEQLKGVNGKIEAQINTLQNELTALTATGMISAKAIAEQSIAENEPEVEIELIVDEETLLELPVNSDIANSSDLPEAPTPRKKTETIESPAVPVAEEMSIVEPVPVVEPVAPVKEQPLHNTTSPLHNTSQPLQTSLFGSTVEDIRQAISLGDRFLFQRELFAGNGELMQKTLDEINTLTSLNEAMKYVLDNFDWDQESTAVKLFENVLKRRFN